MTGRTRSLILVTELCAFTPRTAGNLTCSFWKTHPLIPLLSSSENGKLLLA